MWIKCKVLIFVMKLSKIVKYKKNKLVLDCSICCFMLCFYDLYLWYYLFNFNEILKIEKIVVCVIEDLVLFKLIKV